MCFRACSRIAGHSGQVCLFAFYDNNLDVNSSVCIENCNRQSGFYI
jgi:hypothetical protein